MGQKDSRIAIKIMGAFRAVVGAIGRAFLPMKEVALLPCILAVSTSLSAQMIFSGDAIGQPEKQKNHEGEAQRVRESQVSGTFYPGDKEELRKKIKAFLDGVSADTANSSERGGDGRIPFGLIVPHAGYEYSGSIAARGYAKLAGKPIDTVIVLGPLHKNRLKGVAVFSGKSWHTPLGNIPVDRELAQAIRSEDERFREPLDYHDQKEHSVEVHGPFIKTVLPQVHIVPILVNDLDLHDDLARAIVKHIKGKKVALIASSDMTHHKKAQEVKDQDQHMLEAIANGDAEAIKKLSLTDKGELCGTAAVMTVLAALKRVSPTGISSLLRYGHSGETTGDHESVVGYGSHVLYAGLDEERQSVLLKLARRAISQFLKNKEKINISSKDKQISEPKAVFVTLKTKDGKLRGCIGRTQPESPLYLAVRDMAIEAATQDSRFSPVTLEELESLRIEISVLGPMIPIASYTEFVFKEDGLVIEKDGKKGLFLPEVAESFPDAQAFMSELCEQKAGLPRECWKDPQTKLSIFKTLHFEEK